MTGFIRSINTPKHTVDVRALPNAREVTVYKDGGLFPVLTLTPDGTVVAVLRGGAGHLGLDGRIEIVRSLDGGVTWTPPNVVADSNDADDRNPALGTSGKGTIILAYARATSYDAQGNYFRADEDAPKYWQLMVTRSHDKGLTWEKPYPLGNALTVGAGSPYGKIVQLPDGTLLMTVYGRPEPALLGHRAGRHGDCVYLLRSRDDGLTWVEPSLIGVDMNETALAVLPDGHLLAVMRSANREEQALYTTHSSDGGRTWTDPVQVTAAFRHPADVVMLSNGDLLLTYGNRTPPYRIEGRLSRNGGRTWLDVLLTFSGHLYGYTVDAPRKYDLGYPSSVVHRGKGVTMYYYNPSLNERKRLDTLQREGNAFYLAQDYYAIAVTWDEKELLGAVQWALAERS